MIGVLASLLVGAAVALTPTANPAEAIDEAACVGLPLQTFAGEIVSARIVPRAGTTPSHCYVIATLSEAAVEIRLPIAPWTGELVIAQRETPDDVSRGAALAWSALAQPEAVRSFAIAIAIAYYHRAPTRVLP